MVAYFMRKSGLTFCILALVAFAVGCGVDRSPVASSSDEEGSVLAPAAKKGAQNGNRKGAENGNQKGAENDNQRGAKNDSQRGAKNDSQRGAKNDNQHRVTRTTDVTMQVASIMGVKSGKITVQPGEEIEVVEGSLKIMFRVPKGALDKGESIEMAVYAGDRKGNRLAEGTLLKASNLFVHFGPDGLTFKKNCKMQINVDAPMVDVDPATLVPTHWHGDSVDQAGILGFDVDEETGSISLNIEVPGFSRYSLRR